MVSKPKSGSTIAKQVPAATRDRESWVVPRDGRLEDLAVRIYAGAENTLHLRLYHEQNSGAQETLITPIGKTYIDGDDDKWVWDLSIPVRQDDELVVDYENTDGANAHNFRVTFDVDYHNALERASAALKGVLS